jgi:uncharacterized tellurite resistance protein B-like protein
MALREETYDVYLDLEAGGQSFSLRFPSFEARTLQPLIDRWGTVPEAQYATPMATPVATAVRAEDTDVSAPFDVLISALMFAATIDRDIDEREERYIKNVCKPRPESFDRAHAYYEGHSPEDLLGLLPALDETQKLCLLANVIEIAMVDGVLHTAEQEFVKRMASVMGIADDVTERLRDVLLLKNQTSVFGEYQAAP